MAEPVFQSLEHSALRSVFWNYLFSFGEVTLHVPGVVYVTCWKVYGPPRILNSDINQKLIAFYGVTLLAAGWADGSICRVPLKDAVNFGICSHIPRRWRRFIWIWVQKRFLSVLEIFIRQTGHWSRIGTFQQSSSVGRRRLQQFSNKIWASISDNCLLGIVSTSSPSHWTKITQSSWKTTCLYFRKVSHWWANKGCIRRTTKLFLVLASLLFIFSILFFLLVGYACMAFSHILFVSTFKVSGVFIRSVRDWESPRMYCSILGDDSKYAGYLWTCICVSTAPVFLRTNVKKMFWM
jgi:hypothetical protein